MSVDNPAILDAGSCTFKAGLAINFPSEEEPRVVSMLLHVDSCACFAFHSAPCELINLQVTPAAVRDESDSHGHGSGAAEIRAVDNGAIVDWDAYEALVDDILYAQVSA